MTITGIGDIVNHYEIIVEQNDTTKTYKVVAANASEAYNRIYEQLTKENISFNIVNLSKRDTGTNYGISESV